ncbi:MAG TPA: hypothetical protein VGL56_16450 [Fimbriimonadaceae bacterium]|jgi:uncharacterized lipoprotein YajG
MRLLSNVKLLAALLVIASALSLTGCKKPADVADASPTTKAATTAANNADPNAPATADADQPKDASDSDSDRTTEDDASKGRRADARKSLGL